MALSSCGSDDDPVVAPPTTEADAVAGFWTLSLSADLLLVGDVEVQADVPIELRLLSSDENLHYYEVLLDGTLPVSGVSPNRCLNDPVETSLTLEEISPLPAGSRPGAAVFDEDAGTLSIGVTGFATLVDVNDGFADLPGAAYFALDLRLVAGGDAPRWRLDEEATRPNGLEVVGPGWDFETAFQELCQHLWVGARFTAASME